MKTFLIDNSYSEAKPAAWNSADRPPNPTENPVNPAPTVPPNPAAATAPDENSKNDNITVFIIGVNKVNSSHTVFQNTIEAQIFMQFKAVLFIESFKTFV